MSAEPARPTVFLVDDDPSVRRALGRVLRWAGLAVEEFASAEDFLARRGAGEAPGCLVLDLTLPGLAGQDLCRLLALEASRGGEGGWPVLPIVLMSAHEEEL